MMTDTTVEVRGIDSDANIISNAPLATLAQKDLAEVGGFTYSADEMKFAEDLQKTLPPGAEGHFELTSSIMPLKPVDPSAPAASTDVGDISWHVPTIGFTSATFVPGVAPHTWQAAASAGMSIGQEGMLVSAKSIAVLGADLFASPDVLAAAKADLQNQLKTKTYKSAIPPNTKPPLDYREN